MTAGHAPRNELQLARTADDRRLYALEGVGTLRLTGWASRAGTAEVGALSRKINRRRFWPRAFQAADAASVYEGRSLRLGGALRWCERELALRPESVWRERYGLLEGDRQLATIERKSRGKRPLNITGDDDWGTIDPGLLLCAAFVGRTLAQTQTRARRCS